MKAKNLIISHYKVLNKIGEGNKGIIYKVHDLFTSKILALKVLFSKVEDIVSKNYIKEQFFKLVNLDHKNLIKIYDFGINNDEKCYFTMELIEGKTLEEINELNKKTLYQITFQICQALYYLHFNDLIHFNIKPSNIMLIGKNKNPEIKLLDFGLSQHNIIDEKDIIKSINYIAPEVIKLKKVDKRIDFYSLGAVLYKLLTGRLPFDDERLQDLINYCLEKQVPSLREINPNINLELENIVLKLLSKNPINRYNNALEIIEEINTLTDKDFICNKTIQLSNSFVGRKDELNILEKLVIENMKGKGKLFLITGESGIGKTHLLRKFKSSCQLEKCLVISSNCYSSNNISYRPVIEILHKLIVILENKQRKDIIRKFKTNLIRLLPELKDKEYCKDLVKEKFSEIQLPKENEKTTLIEEIYQFLLETKKVFPYVIIIEDFHLVDSETLDMIQYFSVDSPLLIFVTCREEEIDSNEKLKNLVKIFKEEDFYEKLELKRFNFSETKSMLYLMLNSHSIEEELIKTVYNNTMGNPLFIKEEILSLIGENILYQDEGEWVLNEENYKVVKLLSSNVKGLIENRINKLGGKTFEVLEILSISGTGFKKNLIELISSTLDLIQEDTEKILNELVLKFILIEDRDLYSFCHPKIKEVIRLGINEKQKKILHQKIGEILEQIYKRTGIVNSKSEELAYHFVNGIDKEKALDYSLKASEITKKSYAHHKIINHYKNILSISSTDKVKKKLAEMYEIIGKYNESINSWKEVLNNSKDRAERINIYRTIGKMHCIKGNYEEALFYFNKGKEETSKNKSQFNLELSQLYLQMGYCYSEQDNYEDAMIECGNSLETLNGKDPKVLSSIYNLLGRIYFFGKQDYKKSMMYYKKSLKLSEEIGDKKEIINSYRNIGKVYALEKKLDKAINYCNKCLEMSSKIIIDNHLLSIIHSNLGRIYTWKKDYDTANFHILKAMQISKRIGDHMGMIATNYNLGCLYFKRGMSKLALTYLNKALKLSSNLSLGITLLSIYYRIAEVYLNLNEIDKSYEYCKKTLKLAKEKNISEIKGTIYRLLGLIYQKKGDYQKAGKYFKKSEEILVKLELKIHLAETYCCISHFYKKNEELYLEKAKKIYKEFDLIDDFENIKKELKWIREEKIEDTQKYKTLFEITQMITSILPLNQLFPIIVDKIIEITKADRGFLLLLNEKEELDLKLAHKSNKKDIDNASKKINYDIIKNTFESREPILVNTSLENGEKKKNKEGIIMCVPLQTRNKMLGVIYVDVENKKKMFSNNDLEFFSIFANQIAISIENATLYEKLSEKEREASEFKTISHLKITPFNVKKVPEEINKVISISQKIYKENITKFGFGAMIGKTSSMDEIYNLISKIAAYDTSVLLLGESGTGKELVSEEIHKLSKRKRERLLKINVANLNKNLLESELFGYDKGAFTGAYKSKKGKLELANNGTLFLDEIDEIPFDLQSKLLRVLETKNFFKVGGNVSIHSDFRLICATNIKLKDMVIKEKFREDLYYRIHKFVIDIPPLRERKEDIYLLFKNFIENNRIAKEKKIKHISKQAWEIMENYDYPGNVRELLSILEGIVILCEGDQIRLEHLPQHLIEKVKGGIEEKYQKILGEKKLIESYNNKKELIETQSLVETQSSNVSLQFNNLNSLQKTKQEINTLLTDIIKQKINLEETGCIEKFYQQIKKSIITYLLRKLNGNMSKLSRMINLSYSTLKRKMKNENFSVNSENEIDKKDPLLSKVINLVKIIIDNSIANNEKEINLIFDIEKKIIEITLDEMKWEKNEVCKLLGVDHRTLNKKIAKYKIKK